MLLTLLLAFGSIVSLGAEEITAKEFFNAKQVALKSLKETKEIVNLQYCIEGKVCYTEQHDFVEGTVKIVLSDSAFDMLSDNGREVLSNADYEIISNEEYAKIEVSVEYEVIDGYVFSDYNIGSDKIRMPNPGSCGLRVLLSASAGMAFGGPTGAAGAAVATFIGSNDCWEL